MTISITQALNDIYNITSKQESLINKYATDVIHIIADLRKAMLVVEDSDGKLAILDERAKELSTRSYELMMLIHKDCVNATSMKTEASLDISHLKQIAADHQRAVDVEKYNQQVQSLLLDIRTLENKLAAAHKLDKLEDTITHLDLQHQYKQDIDKLTQDKLSLLASIDDLSAQYTDACAKLSEVKHNITIQTDIKNKVMQDVDVLRIDHQNLVDAKDKLIDGLGGNAQDVLMNIQDKDNKIRELEDKISSMRIGLDSVEAELKAANSSRGDSKILANIWFRLSEINNMIDSIPGAAGLSTLDKIDKIDAEVIPDLYRQDLFNLLAYGKNKIEIIAKFIKGLQLSRELNYYLPKFTPGFSLDSALKLEDAVYSSNKSNINIVLVVIIIILLIALTSVIIYYRWYYSNNRYISIGTINS